MHNNWDVSKRISTLWRNPNLESLQKDSRLTLKCCPSHAQMDPFKAGIGESSPLPTRSRKNSILSDNTRMSYFRSVAGTSVLFDGRRSTSFPSRRNTTVATAASSDGSPVPGMSVRYDRGNTGMFFRKYPRYRPNSRRGMDDAAEIDLTELYQSGRGLISSVLHGRDNEEMVQSVILAINK